MKLWRKLFVPLVFVVGPGVAAVPAASLEYEVKASYLYNFIQFIDWPEDAFDNGDFNICVLGTDRFGTALDVRHGESAGRRMVRVQRFDRAAAGARCHVMFVSGTEDSARVLPMIVHKAVLTVGEAPGFTAHGGVINLVETQGRIRFHVNVKAAQRAGLTVSSRLLKLAVDQR